MPVKPERDRSLLNVDSSGVSLHVKLSPDDGVWQL